MLIILFEDDEVARLAPVTLGKPAFATACGSYRLVDLVAELGQPISAVVRPHLVDLVAADYPALVSDRVTRVPVLAINARVVPSVASLQTLQQLLSAGRTGVVRCGESIAAAVLAEAPPLADRRTSAIDLAQHLAKAALPPVAVDLPVFDYPHDIIRHHLAAMRDNLAHRLAHGGYQEIAEGVFAAAGAKLGQYIVTDTTHGPIVLEEGATVGPYCYLSGPVHIGPKARVLEHAALKDCVAIGHTTKIGGEVEASIIEPYTNKQHHGFLGHSYLGSWINLGAGTCNSDLKNTYGQVNVEHQGRKVPTGMQFVGATIGDYAKTAINTGIFTGKSIGVCSMVYGFVTTNVPSFVNYARLFGQVTEAPVEVMLATQRRMFARRGVEQRGCDVQLLHDMYQLTASERHIPGETLSLEPLSL